METSKEDVEHMFAVNVFGPIFLTQAAMAHMSAGGRIINISSVAAKVGPAVMPIYGASKAAMDSLSFSWANEVSQARVGDRKSVV